MCSFFLQLLSRLSNKCHWKYIVGVNLRWSFHAMFIGIQNYRNCFVSCGQNYAIQNNCFCRIFVPRKLDMENCFLLARKIILGSMLQISCIKNQFCPEGRRSLTKKGTNNIGNEFLCLLNIFGVGVTLYRWQNNNTYLFTILITYY